MRDKYLSLALSLSFVFSLGYLMAYIFYFNAPIYVSLPELNRSYVGERVEVCGIIEDIDIKSNYISFYLSAENERIKVLSYEIIDLIEGEVLCVIGRVKYYKNNLFIVFDEVSK